MRAMPETDMITLRPMEEFVNHIGVDEFRVFIKICLFGFCGFAFFITWRRACVPLFVRPADDDGSGDVPTDAPLIRKGHTVSTAKLGHFPRFTKKKQIFSPSALPNCRYRLAFRTARLHFSGITLRGTKDEIREKHPHGIAGEKRIRTFA